MKPLVGLIDYGAGNIFSVENALREINCNVVTATEPEMLKGVDKLILPGVGAFPEGMSKLHSLGFASYLDEYINSGNHLLGICLGMQLLLSIGNEGGKTNGLGFIKGYVEPLQPTNNCRIPHIGWNDIYNAEANESLLFNGIEPSSSFYFVHSYHVILDEVMEVNYTNYCDQDVVASYQKENLFGTQFHPEKSQKVGIKLLRNFIEFEE